MGTSCRTSLPEQFSLSASLCHGLNCPFLLRKGEVMSVTLSRTSACVMVSLSCLLLGRSPLPAQGEQGRKAEPAPKRVTQLIDAIANKNKEPQLVGDRANGKLPFFPEDYDWKEQGRVVGALGKLKSDSTEELWEELL